MKKLIPIILSILILIPSNITFAADKYISENSKFDFGDAYQFTEELKELESENLDSSLRLIVTSSKQIDYLDAVNTATGIDDLYVLQFDNELSFNLAYDYYQTLPYVEYVEKDTGFQEAVCEDVYSFNFTPNCSSTVNQNIDDAIKLLEKENIKASEIRVGVIDSGIALTSFTKGRVDGGCTFLDGYEENGTDDRRGHGTKVAGTIIQNSTNNIKLYSYQIIDSSGRCSLLDATAAIYQGIEDGCKVLNCSFGKSNGGTVPQFMADAVDKAINADIAIIAAAGNNSSNMDNDIGFPALIDGVLTVGATTQSNKLASFSNFGEIVDIYATGYGMTSYDNSGNQVVNWNGTSASTPVISSICALLITAKPDITVNEVKQLLIETGYSTNEENQSDKDRIIADAYGCIKKLLGKELEQVQLDYSVTKNETTGCSDISFSSKDKDVKIYYELGLGSLPEIPYKEMTGASQYEYKLGDTIKLSKWHMITVAAYAPGKAKKVLYFSAPEYSNESGYRLTQSSSTQQYNKIDRCQIIDQKVIEVPETINGTEVQQIGIWCFAGNKTVEKIILPESVKQIDYYAFSNCPNLKEVIAPGVKICGMYAFSDCKNLVNVEMPNVTAANTGMFKNCTSLETAKLGTLTEIDNHAFYGCENLKLVKTTADDISFAFNTFKDCNKLTIYTPANSSMETFAKQNSIPLLGDVQANGGSIRVTDAGLRFGYQYNGEYNKNIEEYGFVYNSGITDDLTVDNSLKLVANNRINHGDYTTYNLVFTDVPYTDKAFNQMISAKAYIKIGGEYFYSDVVQHSYNTVANAVLNDDAIDSNTKDAVQNILEKVV